MSGRNVKLIVCSERRGITGRQRGNEQVNNSYAGSFLVGSEAWTPDLKDRLHVSTLQVKYFWVPDLYYVEAKDVVYPSQINPPRSLLLYNNGPDKDCRLVFKSKETVTIGCQFDFKMYPLDVNLCHLNMRSCKSRGSSKTTSTLSKRPRF